MTVAITTAHWRRPKASGPMRPESVAAAAAMGVMIVAAALPSDGDAARSATPGSTPAVQAATGPETTFGAYLGAPYHYPSDFRLIKDGRHDATLKDVEWYTLPFKNPLYYGARIQRWLAGGRFGTMVDFVHSKAYAPLDKETRLEGTLDGQPLPETGTLNQFFKRLEFTHGHNMLTLNGLARLGSLGVIQPYVGAGAGISLPHSEMHVASDPSRTYEYQYTGPTAQVLFGLEWRLKTGSVFLEYKFTIADYRAPITHIDGSWLPLDMWRQFSRWWSGEEPPGGWGETRLSSHQVVGGFTVRFAPVATAAP
jgi:lipid A oxidase